MTSHYDAPERPKWRNASPPDPPRIGRRTHLPLKRRLLEDGERTYTAYSAHELLELEAEVNQPRPGQAY